jgi:hypothetical protein
VTEREPGAFEARVRVCYQRSHSHGRERA